MKSNYTKLIKGICVILLYILMPEILAMFVPSIQESNTLDLIYRCLFMFLLLLLYIYIYKDDIIKEVKTFLSRPLKIVGSSLIYFLFLILGIGTISAVLLSFNMETLLF